MRMGIGLIIFFVVCVSIAWGTTGYFQLRSIQEKITFAYNLDDASLLDSSIQDLNQLLQQYPNDLGLRQKAFILMGDAYFYRGSYDQALASYQQAQSLLIVSDTDYPYVLYSKAYTLYYAALNATGNLQAQYIRQAISAIDEISSFSEYAQDAFLLRGMVLRLSGDYMSAVAFLDRVTREDLRPTASYYKGLVLYEQRNYAAAVLAFQQAQRQGQDKELVAASIYQVVKALMNLQNYREALQHSEILVRDYSDTRFRGDIMTLHVELLYQSGSYDSALRYIDTVIQSAPSTRERMDALIAKGWITYKNQRIDMAIDLWTQAMELGARSHNQEAFEAAKNVMGAMREGGDYSGLVAFLNRVKSLFPEKTTELDLETAKIYIAMRRIDEAEVLLRRVLATGLAFQEANYWMAQLFLQKGDFRQALDTIERVIQSGTPRYVFLGQSFKGDVLFQTRDYPKSREAYRKALEVAGDQERTQTLINLGIVAMAMQNYTEADGYFQQLKDNYQQDVTGALNAAFYLAESYALRNQFVQASREYDWIIQNDTTGRFIRNATIKKFEMLILSTTIMDPIIQQIDQAIAQTGDALLKKELAYLRGEAFLRKGDVLSAYNAISGVQTEGMQDSSKAGMLYIRARYFTSIGNRTEADRAYSLLIQQYPQSAKAPWGLQDYALSFYHRGDYDQSKNLFFQLITTYPTFSKVDAAYFYIGLSYERLGDPQRALRIYEELLQKFPNTDRLNETRERINQLKTP